MRGSLQEDMRGRNGLDPLTYALGLVLLLLLFCNWITREPFYAFLAFGVLMVGYFRVLSKNLEARRRENNAFLDWWEPFSSRVRELFHMAGERRTHSRFACPACGQKVRVPKGRGTIRIRCPRCGQDFIQRS